MQTPSFGLPAREARRTSTGQLLRSTSIDRLLYAILLAASAAYIGAFVVAAAFRLTFPYPLEVTESASLVQVQRILDGQSLYVEPTLRHVPLIYGPVLYYLSALLALVMGPTYAPLRLVSLVASVGSIGLIAGFVLHESHSHGAALVAAGLFAATYPLAQTALDLGRVDSVFVFLILAGLYLTYIEGTSRVGQLARVLAGGALLGIAALAKAPIAALPVAAAAAVYLLLRRPLSVAPFAVGCVVCLGGGLLLLRLQSGPWPTWFLWDLPRLHELRPNLVPRFWFTDILPRFTLPLLIGPAFLLMRLLQGKRCPLLFYGAMAVSLIGVAWASRSNVGASTNVLLPALAVVAVFFGLGLNALLRLTQSPTVSANARVAMRSYVVLLCVVQLALIVYNPRLTVPYRSDQAADAELAARLAALPGPLFAPDLEGYAPANGDEQPYLIAVGDMSGQYGGQPTAEGSRWWAELGDALEGRRFQSVVVRDEDCCALQTALANNGYTDAGPLFAPDDAFWLNKSSHTPDVHLYLPPR